MRRHDALLSALRRGAGVALAPEAVGSRGMTSLVAATAARASCVPSAARPALPHDRHLSRSLSPAHRRWYATGRAGASGSFAVPHPTRADTLRYPARAAGAAAALDPKLKGAMVGRPDPLASRSEGGPGGDAYSCGPWTDQLTAAANHQAHIALFNDAFPEFEASQQPVSIAGESYAGVYVPLFIDRWLDDPVRGARAAC